MITPYLEYRGETDSEYWIENAFTVETANLITEALIEVVENPNGTAYSARIDGLTLAGKTGTAEIKQSQTDTEGTELGWFCAYTPDKDTSDSMLIVSMVEDVKERGGSGYLLDKSKAVFESIYSN